MENVLITKEGSLFHVDVTDEYRSERLIIYSETKINLFNQIIGVMNSHYDNVLYFEAIGNLIDAQKEINWIECLNDILSIVELM